MTRPLSDIPAHELPALVEQGMPIEAYEAEMKRRRQPDCVFNVWPDGYAYRAIETAEHSASSWRDWNKYTACKKYHVTHRIRVFLKERAP